MRPVTLLVIVLVGNTIIGSVADAQTTADQTTIAVQGNNSAQVEERITGILAQIDGLEGVTVTASDGVVSLSGVVQDRQAIEDAERLAARVEGVVAVQNNLTLSDDLSAQLDPVFDRLSDRLSDAWDATPLFLLALAVFVSILVFGFWAARPRGVWDRLAPNGFIADIYRRVVLLAFSILALVVALDILNATALLGTVLGAAGLLGLAIGFAVRDTVENFIASVMLSLRQPFRHDDLVDIEGDMGFVLRVSSRATVLLSIDGNQIRIPNARVFKAKIINYSSQPERRFDFQLGINADADLLHARTVGMDTLRSMPFVLADPAPDVWVEDVGDSNVVLTFTGWIDQTRTHLLVARGEAVRIVKTALENQGFTLPEPIYTLQLNSLPSVAPTGTEIDTPSARGTLGARTQHQPANTANPPVDVGADLTLPRRAAQERALQSTRGDLLTDSPNADE